MFIFADDLCSAVSMLTMK